MFKWEVRLFNKIERYEYNRDAYAYQGEKKYIICYYFNGLTAFFTL